MFRGLFNRLYVGKNKKDLDKEEMQASPVQLFFEILGVRAMDIVKLSLLFSLFCIPAFVWAGYNISALFSMGADETYVSYVLIFLAGMIPCLWIIAPGLCGLSAVTGRFAREGYVWLVTDFVAGIKSSWKQGLLMSLINGIALFATMYGFYFYEYMAIQYDTMFFNFLQYFMAILLITILCINIYFWPMLAHYDMPFKQLFRYSFSLMILRLPYTLLFGALTALPIGLFIWASIYWEIAPYLALFVYAAFGFGFIQYMLSFYAHTTFKRYIQDADADAKDIPEHTTQQRPDSRKGQEPQGVWTFLDEDEEDGADQKNKKR